MPNLILTNQGTFSLTRKGPSMIGLSFTHIGHIALGVSDRSVSPSSRQTSASAPDSVRRKCDRTAPAFGHRPFQVESANPLDRRVFCAWEVVP